MDAASIDLFTAAGARDGNRKATPPAPGFDQHLAEDRPRPSGHDDSPRVVRNKGPVDRRPASAQEKQRPEKAWSGDQEPHETPQCCAAQDTQKDDAAADAAATAAQSADAGGDKEDVEEAAAATVIAAAILATPVVEVASVPEVPVVDPTEVTAVVKTDASQEMPIPKTEPTPDATAEAVPAPTAAAELSQVLPVSDQPTDDPNATKVADAKGKKAASAKQAAAKPVVPTDEPKPTEAKEQAAEQATEATPEAEGPKPTSPRGRRAQQAEAEADQGESEEAAPATTAPGTFALDAEAIASDAQAAANDAAAAPAAKADADAGPAPVNAASSTSRAADVPAPQPLSTRLPGHLVGRGGERAESPSRAHDVDQARFLQRVAKAFETANARDGELRIKLAPPELGSLRIEIKVQEGVMNARVEAETPEARAILLDNLGSLRERLAEQNMKIDRFDVDLMDRNTQGNAQNPQEEQPSPAPRNTPARIADRGGAAETETLSLPSIVGSGKLNVIV